MTQIEKPYTFGSNFGCNLKKIEFVTHFYSYSFFVIAVVFPEFGKFELDYYT